MKLHSKKGHNLNLAGAPSDSILKKDVVSHIKLHPKDFPGIKPKLLVSEGDSVKKSQPIYFDKNNPNVMFTSFYSGYVDKIVYGEKRSIESINIKIDHDIGEVSFDAFTLEEIKNINMEKVVEIISISGLWPCIRRRPFSKIAIPENLPKSIFISTYATYPYSPSINVLLEALDAEQIQAGINALIALSSVDIHIIIPKGLEAEKINNLEGVNIHTCSGPHPSGNVGYHISNIDPIKDKDDCVWYISIQDLVAIGNLFLKGLVIGEKIITVGGCPNSIDNTHLIINRNSLISDILPKNINTQKNRIISGDILSGSISDLDKSIGFYDNVVSVINDEFKREFIGWLSPGLNKYSLTRTFLSKMLPLKPMLPVTSMNGGVRSIVPIGLIERMCNLDILPTMLLKAIIANDIEMMEELGIYECAPEDFSLCSYIDASKMDIKQIIQDGLDYAEVEG